MNLILHSMSAMASIKVLRILQAKHHGLADNTCHSFCQLSSNQN